MSRYKKRGEYGIILPEVNVTNRGNYIRYTGNETNIPNFDTFKKSKIKETRINAVKHILAQQSPIVPYVPDTNPYVNINGNYYEIPIKRYINKALDIAGVSNLVRTGILGKNKYPQTCINTATSMYSDKNRVSGNVTFARNPEKYGFTKINKNDSDHGDIYQFKMDWETPDHATILTGFDEEGKPVLSYSNGGVSEAAMQKDQSIDAFGNRPYDVYRFIGNKENEKEWKEQYNKLYNKKQFGGNMRKYNPRHKAFVGAIINAATNVASGIANAVMQHKQQLKQNRQDNYEQGLQTAGVLDQLIANQDVVNEQLKNKVAFKYGGRKKCELGGLGKGILFSALTGAGGIAGAFADRAIQRHDMNQVQVLGNNGDNTISPQLDKNNGITQQMFGGRTQMFMCGGRTKRNRRK